MIRDKKQKYQIVGEYESDIENKKLSINDPLARGLIGKSKDDNVEINSFNVVQKLYYNFSKIHLNISNPKIWSLTDGSQGMISQCRGLALELGSDIKEIETDILFPWNKLQPGFLPVYRWIFRNKIPNRIPDIVISCGRKSVYLSIFLKRKFPKIINIHIQNPKISSKEFSFVIAPNHDNIKGYNIINSIGAIHHFKNSRKTIENNINVSDKKGLITCIIGGENNHYLFSKKKHIIYVKK